MMEASSQEAVQQERSFPVFLDSALYSKVMEGILKEQEVLSKRRCPTFFKCYTERKYDSLVYISTKT